METVADVKTLKGKYDAIVVAAGTKQMKVNIEGVDNKNVATAVQVLTNPELVKNAKNIVVAGGGDAGSETAYFLKYELGKDVTIVEYTPNLMATACTANRGHIIHYLEKAGVTVHNCSSVKSINSDNTVTITKNVSKTVPSPFNTWSPILPENIHNPLAKKIKVQNKEINIPADFVVIAYGIKNNDDLYLELVKENAAKEIYNIGDSNIAGKVFTAVKSAYRKAITI